MIGLVVDWSAMASVAVTYAVAGVAFLCALLAVAVWYDQ